MILRNKRVASHRGPVELRLALHGHRSEQVKVARLLLHVLLPVQELHLSIEECLLLHLEPLLEQSLFSLGGVESLLLA